jgi:hypothetical protein
MTAKILQFPLQRREAALEIKRMQQENEEGDVRLAELRGLKVSMRSYKCQGKTHYEFTANIGVAKITTSNLRELIRLCKRDGDYGCER